MKAIQEKINEIQAEILETYEKYETGGIGKIEAKNKILSLVGQWDTLNSLLK